MSIIEEIFIDYSHIDDIDYEHHNMTKEEYKKVDIKHQ